MKNLWNEKEASRYFKDDLALRVYTSRLIGKSSNLVLHGGGNTSVKSVWKDEFGDKQEVLYVKGSGWDLATIEKPGFAPVLMETLLKMAKLNHLTDSKMVELQRRSMLDLFAPNPSVEAIMHAVIPFKFVDHTHADSVVTLTNNPQADKILKQVYGKSVLVVPYVMPGFVLAKEIYKLAQTYDLSKYEGLILKNHGVFTFSDNAKESYSKMIQLVSLAEKYITKKKVKLAKGKKVAPISPLEIAKIRKEVSIYRGAPVLARVKQDALSVGFATLKNAEKLACSGPITPDHTIRIKPSPVVLKQDAKSVMNFANNYSSYFKKNAKSNQSCLDLAPRWGLFPKKGLLSFGKTIQECLIISDIIDHTIESMQKGHQLGGWLPLNEKDIFEMEYWELEQAKLKQSKKTLPMTGKVALITGAAAGIGKACAERLHAEGAVVIALDLNPKVETNFNKPDFVGIACDVTDEKKMKSVIEKIVTDFGGIDTVVCNAGIFTAGQYIQELDPNLWAKSMAVNLTSAQQLLKLTIPYLEQGIDPSVVIMGSRNVGAPGPGAAAYSVAKAGLTQLARVASLELAPKKIRVNTIHPDAVFDTELWTKEALQRSAKRYGMTVQEYKTKNLMKSEIKSTHIAEMVCAVAGTTFIRTTGAQIPIDGGNERII